MKDGFRRFEVEPVNDTLDFMGPPRSSDTIKLLEGNVRLSLTRPVKIRSMAIKFKGFGKVDIKGKFNHVNICQPMLPKLKCTIAGKTNLSVGDHLIPWDMEIPNLYPPSLSNKRCSVYYRIEVVITFHLAKSITIEHPIILRRHLLPCMEFAPLVETKLYDHTVPAKFHYEIEAPQIICLDQQVLPFAVKYLCIANQKAVQNIRTQLTQIELYRMNTISKTDSDLTQIPMDLFNLEAKVIQCKDRRDYAKFVKRTIPAFIHSVDQTRSSAWKQPIVLRHKLHPFLQSTFDSPLVTIHHQLEITFQFDHRFEDIKAKIPIIIASIPSSSQNKKILPPIMTSAAEHGLNPSPADSKYPFETITRFESMNVVPEVNDRSVPRASEDSTMRCAVASVIMDPNVTQLDLHDQPPLPPLPTLSKQQQQKQNNQNDIPIWKSALPLPPPPSSHHQNKINHPRKNNIITHGQPKQHLPENYNRCNSALDFNMYEQQQQQQQQQLMIHEERPRTTTPFQRRQDGTHPGRRRRQLPPIDVELANGLKPKIKIIVNPLSQKTNSSSEVLPEADRDIILSSKSNKHQQLQQQSTNDVNEYEEEDEEVKYIMEEEEEEDDDDPFDFQSVYSDLSLASPGAPSLSSSATEASVGSHHTLLTRPPSPSFRPAPGLPANVALRSHDERPTALVEESFQYTTITSPAIATVASSVILSPCQSSASTTSSNRRRIALSSVSSIMNSAASASGTDAISFRSFGGPFPSSSSSHAATARQSNGSSIIPLSTTSSFHFPSQHMPPLPPYPNHHKLLSPLSLRDSVSVDPDNQDLIQQSISPNSMNTAEAKQHYLHAKLPPIPTSNQQQDPTSSSLPSLPPLPSHPLPHDSQHNEVIPRRRRRRKNPNGGEDEDEDDEEVNTTKRMTRLYTDDSDDETLDPLPPIPEKRIINTIATTHPFSSSTTSSTHSHSPNNNNSNNTTTTPLILSSGPPQLPRLSFGIALGDALGLDQFKKKF